MPKVIVNSTPLIVLCGIGRLEILKKLYQEIYIPLAVYEKVTGLNINKRQKTDRRARKAWKFGRFWCALSVF